MLDVLDLPYFQNGLAEVLLLSVGCGVLGTWIVLRGLAFFTHAASAATFPGLVLADGLGFLPAAGAFAAAGLFALGFGAVALGRRGGQDSATALVLVAALALGIVLASDVFHSGASVESLLFGSLLLIEARDLALAAAMSVLVLAASGVLGSRWLAAGFDSDQPHARAPRAVDAALLALVALAATASLAAVGALLSSALLVIPATTTRLFTNRLAPWQAASVALAAAEGVAGMFVSDATNAPPGACIAAITGAVFALAVAVRVLRRRRGTLAAFAALGLAALTGCGAGGGGKPEVVATTTQIGEWARAVGGPAITVRQLLRPNTDPHDYEPRPDDVKQTAVAKVVLVNGDELDAWSAKLVDQGGGSAEVVDLGASLPQRVSGETSGPERSRYDPHWWHDPRNAQAAVSRIAAALSKADPAHRAAYEGNARRYIARVRALDRSLAACFAQVPAARRKLVTDHDAFTYFARRYGIRVVGAVIPSQTTQAQPSAGALAGLARVIEQEGVSAVFPESSLNAKLAQAVAARTGATAKYKLYGDTLGPAGSSGATYLDMERANADAMVRGFTGGARGCPGKG